jgi:hypothetical protein
MIGMDGTRVRPGFLSRIRGRGDAPKVAGVGWPVGWRCVVAVALLGVLAGLAYEAGKQSSPGPMSSKKVPYVIMTLTKPAVAIPLATAIVLVLISIARRLRFEWLVFKPGPIFVRDLAVAPGVTDIDISHLTTLFRVRLMQLRLHAPAPVPGATPAEDLLSVLDAEHLDAKNVLGSVVSVLRAALPTHGYEVSVTLTQENAAPPGKPRLGVTAQLARLPNEAVPIDTAWADSWDDAITQAADMVTAVVLPRTRLSNRAPWSGWRRYQMPGLVVHCYEKSQELTSARRYDEALSHCFQALTLDPKSVDLRLCKGFIEEKLGLYMDAVATYAAARRVADKTSRRLYNRRARRHRHASGRIATYRLAVLLGGRKFAHQWRKPDCGTRRDRQRTLVRERLSPELQALLEQHDLLPSEPERGNLPPNQAAKRNQILALLEKTQDPQKSREPRESGDVDDDDPCYFELRRLLAQLAASELSDLQRSVTRHRTQRGSLTPLSVKLTAAAVQLRLCYLDPEAARRENACSGTRTSSLEWARAEIADTRRRRPFRTWAEEYSAAIYYALPLLVNPARAHDGRSAAAKKPDEEARRADDELRTALAKLAVEHLKRAMSSTPSLYAAERRDWVLSEDPDLDGLRACRAFKHFETIYFPSPAPTPRRPPRASRWEMSRYTHALLADTARRWETVWHQRRDLVVSNIDPHVVIQWSKDEASAWRMVGRMARDYRHWPARCELIEQMKDWSAKYGFDPLDVGLPRFVRDNGIAHDPDQSYGDLCADVLAEVELNETRFDTLLCELRSITASSDGNGHEITASKEKGSVVAHVPNAPVVAERSNLPPVRTRVGGLWWSATARLRADVPPVRQFERLQIELSDRDFWHRAAPPQFLQSVCDVHAAMWQRLHEWLEASAHDYPTGGEHFKLGIDQSARLSGTSGVGWVTEIVARRLMRLSPGETPYGADGTSRQAASQNSSS